MFNWLRRKKTKLSPAVSDAKITTYAELVSLAWKVGVVYFQVYDREPNPEFYRYLPRLRPYEQIVEIQSDSAPELLSYLEFKGRLPFFGCISGGWSCGLTDNPQKVTETVFLARKGVVLPGSVHKRTADDDLLIEGLPTDRES